ncbi:MAG: hypothetical protein QMC96_10665, partial [Methanomicrobiales archaeon]|nr:hypothetical protein [Methanomicrobiales archaeon]
MVNLLIRGSGVFFSMLLTINRWLVSLGSNPVISGYQVSNALNTVIGVLVTHISAILNNIPGILFGAFILFLSLYLFLLKGEDIYRQILDAIPDQLTDSVRKIQRMVVNTMRTSQNYKSLANPQPRSWPSRKSTTISGKLFGSICLP